MLDLPEIDYAHGIATREGVPQGIFLSLDKSAGTKLLDGSCSFHGP